MILFSKPFVPKVSIEYVNQALTGIHQQGDGPFSDRASSKISTLSGGGKVLLTPSCTAALEMASMLSGIKADDEVILPSYTFTSAATAVTQFGGVPVFVDISSETGCIDAQLIRKAITSKTKAISWVNYGGNVPDIEEIIRISKEYNLLLIEDNAHGFGGEFKGRRLGSIGHFSTLSFHATKNIQCGEGGALVINDDKYFERAEIFREKGTNRKLFFAGNVQKYQWVDKGSSYLLAEVLAAQLYGQLLEFEEIQKNRVQVWDYYFQELFQCLNAQGHQTLRPNGENIAHLFAVIFQTKESKIELIKKLAELGTQINSHYQPLHTSIAGQKMGRAAGEFENTRRFGENLVRLPIWSHTGPQEYYKEVVASILKAHS